MKNTFRQALTKLNSLNSLIWFLVASLFFALLIYLFFAPILQHPNNFLFGIWGDQIKNYYTFLYYIKFDKGFWFTGMNYPFGEHITFPDTQPILAFVLGFINRNIINISEYSVGILNSVLILSMIPAGLFLYLILRKNFLPPLYAIIAASLILLLSPQHFRLTRHYGLAYSFIIPALWYIIIKTFENPKKWSWYIAFVLLAFFSTLLHAYFGLIAALFLLAYIIVYTLQEIKYIRRNIWFVCSLLITALLPLLLYQVWLLLTDPVTDRPIDQYGFFVYTTSFGSIFFPWISPYKELWQNLFYTSEPIEEGQAYVGMIGLVCFILTLIRLVKYIIKFQFNRIFRPALPFPLRTGIWAAILVVFYAMAYPFKWGIGFEKLLEIIPQLKQFRSLGRFAWIFYYVFSVYTAFYFYQLYRHLSIKNLQQFGAGLLIFILFIWAIDARTNLLHEVKEIKQNDLGEYFSSVNNSYSNHLASANYYVEDFQAIIPLPYFMIGPEKFTLDRSEAQFESFRASLNTGLPLVANMMSRTSNQHALTLVQLFSNDLIEKAILQKLPSRKPFLILLAKNADLDLAEQNLLSKCEKIFENEKIVLYKLAVNNLKSTNNQAIRNFNTIKKDLIIHGSLLSTGKLDNIVYRDFQENSTTEGLFDKGNIKVEQSSEVVLFDSRISMNADTTHYEASIWLNSLKTYELPVLHYKQYSEDGILIEEKEIHLKKSREIFNSWVRGSLDFQLKDPKNRISIYLSTPGKALADNLLIKPINQAVYLQPDKTDRLILNNFPIKF